MANIKEFLHSTLAAAGETSTEGLPEEIKCIYMCAPDLRKELEWLDVCGIRRIKEIRYYSEQVNATYSINAYLKRVFSYYPTYPRDLYEIQDALVAL